MATAITPLANVTITSTTSTVEFSSISDLYQDLRLVFSHKMSANPTVENTYIRINSDSGSNYNQVGMYSAGTGAVTWAQSNQSLMYVNADDPSDFTLVTIDFLDYSSTSKHKSMLWRLNWQANWVMAQSWRWASTSKITSIKITSGDPATKGFAAGSTFTLYGVKA